MSILYNNARNVRFVLFRKTSSWKITKDEMDSSLSQTHKVGNVGIIAYSVLPFNSSFILLLYQLMIVKLKLELKEYTQIKFQGYTLLKQLIFIGRDKMKLTMLAMFCEELTLLYTLPLFSENLAVLVKLLNFIIFFNVHKKAPFQSSTLFPQYKRRFLFCCFLMTQVGFNFSSD